MENQKQSDSQELAELKSKLVKYENMVKYQDSDVDINKLWGVVWGNKWKIIAITFIFSIASVLYALSLPDIYKSEALLAPNSEESNQGGLGALAGQLGGLASLAGVNLGGGSNDKTDYAMEVLKSREFLYDFIQNNDLKIAIMAVNGWSRDKDEFIINEDVYDTNLKVWVRSAKFPFKAEPSIHETYQRFVKDNLHITTEKNGMVTLAISHYSPYLANTLVAKLIDSINTKIKKSDLDIATKSIKYLEGELLNTKLAGVQSMFYQLIEQQQQTLMLTKTRNDYVFKIVDTAIVPETKFKPNRPLICVLGSFMGLFFSVLVVLLVNFLYKPE